MVSGMLHHIVCLFLVIVSTLESKSDFDEGFNETVDFIIKEVDRGNIAKVLRHLTLRPHLGGTPAEWENAEWVADTWRSQGLDQVHLTPYKVLLSYPDKQNPNYAKIIDADGAEIWKSQGRSPPLHSQEEFSDEVLPDFNAYSPPGVVMGDIVFVNFGRNEDFDKLTELGVDLTGRIAIAKYGEMFRANIAKNVQDRGAKGLLLYSDPQQYAKEGPDRVYADTVFMPSGAAAFGTVYLEDGDPLTPFYPSIDSAFRIPESEAAVPKIPVMPLSYKDALEILSKMKGVVAPPEWQGGLNITYKVGPGLQKEGFHVKMEVNTHSQMTTTYNVIGVMEGKEEPDRYVILGNHRDAWIFGAIDPSSGTAALLELTRILTKYRNETGWAPRRTLMFCSWGSEEYGLIGSQEWVEQYGKQLGARTVAYINLDMAIEGNYTLRTKSTPLLYRVGRDVTKLIPNPDPSEIAAGRKTVYDTWTFRKPDEAHPGMPAFNSIGGGSDYKSFQHTLGIPCLEYRYTHSKEMYAESLYHTLYETFYLTSELYDRGFNFHAAITQMWGILAVYIADAQVLPFSLDEYATFIEDAQGSLIEKFGLLIQNRNISLDYFQNASTELTNAAQNYNKVISSLNLTNPLAVRRVNDQLMLFERAFIVRRGLPRRPFFNHVIVAPSATDTYAGAAFAGLSDALTDIEGLNEEDQDVKWREFEEHLAVCTHLIQTASKVLTDDLW